MEPYILISNLNDFIFCPRSIYFHNLYGGYTQKNYHRKAQTRGKAAHKTIDEDEYSTSKHIITSLPVYSQTYGIGGKIDIYDSKKKILIERKYKITTIYDGYRYQLYAQYFAMIEAGYEVEKLAFHSLSDNKRHFIDIPDTTEVSVFNNLVNEMKSFDPTDDFSPNVNKCNNCIYNELCDLSLAGT